MSSGSTRDRWSQGIDLRFLVAGVEGLFLEEEQAAIVVVALIAEDRGYGFDSLDL